MKLNHGCTAMVTSLLLDIINEVATDREVPETGTSREEMVEEELQDEDEWEDKEDLIEENVDGQSLIVRLRNERVAKIQAEFKKKYPNFHEEVKKLKVTKKTTNVERRKAPAQNEARRRSSRIGKEGPVQNNEVSDELSGSFNAEHGDDVSFQLGDLSVDQEVTFVQLEDVQLDVSLEHGGVGVQVVDLRDEQGGVVVQVGDLGVEQEVIYVQLEDAIGLEHVGVGVKVVDLSYEQEGVGLQPVDGIGGDSPEHGGVGVQVGDLCDEQGGVLVQVGDLGVEEEVFCVQLEDDIVHLVDVGHKHGGVGVLVKDLNDEQEDVGLQLGDGIGDVSPEHGGVGVQREDHCVQLGDGFVQMENVSLEYGGVSVQAGNLDDEGRDVSVPSGVLICQMSSLNCQVGHLMKLGGITLVSMDVLRVI